MNRAKKLIFAVTNDLSYDQRMIRICRTLSRQGYHVTLVGRKMPGSLPLAIMPYHQFRIHCMFQKGFGFYAEFNLRLFFYLLYKKINLVCAIDLDTILPCYLISAIKNIPRVYDAHELFCEMKEIVTRPRIYRFWKRIENFAVPRFRFGYTVNSLIANEFKKNYGVSYETIRNVPYRIENPQASLERIKKKTIIYQGAVNEGRSFETVIPAFHLVDADLVICGDGNFMQQAKQIVKDNHLEKKIHFTGWLPPGELRSLTREAYIGINVIENIGNNGKLSLSNRFFDYIQSLIPQVCVDYPAYREVNVKFQCAYLIEDTSAAAIAQALNKLLSDDKLYDTLKQNTARAAEVFHWNNEEHKLVSFYQKIFDRA